MERGIARVWAVVVLLSVAACTGSGGGSSDPSGSPATASASVGGSATPTAAPAVGVVTVWPESPFTTTTSREAQERTDAGRAPWRLDPGAVALRFAKTVMAWAVVRVKGPLTPQTGGRGVIGVQIQQLCPPTARCTRAVLSVQDLVLVQPIRGGGDGIWSVASVRSPELELSFPSQPIARVGEPLPVTEGDRFAVAMDLRGGAHAAAGLRTTDGCRDVSEVRDDIRRPRVVFRVPREAAFPSSDCEGPVVGYVFAYSAPRLTQLTGDPFLEPASLWAMTVQPVTVAPRG